MTGALVLVYLGSTILRTRHVPSTLYDSYIGNFGYGGCALLCAWRAWSIRRHRLAWSAIAASLLLFTGGAALWTTVVQFYNPVPYPSIADYCFLAFYPVAYLGVGLLVRESIGLGSRVIWLDGLISAAGIAALEAAFVIGPISRASRGSAGTVATNLAYPIGDLVLVAMLIALFVMRGWRPGRTWWMLGAGLLLFAFADSAYVLRVTAGTYVTGTPLDSLWLIGTFLMASAAWEQRGIERSNVLAQMPLIVPGLFLCSSLSILVFATIRHVLSLAVVFASIALFLAVGRMAVAYRQLRTLAQSRLEARTDELTGLANRRAFFEALRAILAPPAGRLAVLMIDLDRFKEINDNLGHHVGDQVLRCVADRLTEVAVGSGTVARLGGDEFGLIVHPLGSAEETSRLADRICKTVREPLVLDGMTLSVDVSVGIALSSPDGADADTLLQQADIAMYKAKRSHYAFLFYARDPNDDARGRLELMSELRQAIADGEMVPYYQPKVALGTMEIVSVEALVRWVHPSRGVLAPDRFLSLAEQAGLMGPLAMSVLEQAVDQQHAWDCRGIDLSVAVNLSAVNLRDEALPKSIDAILSRRGASAGRVILEITEDCLMVDEEKGRRMLEQLRDLGVELSVDDFGTGYSSLVYLWRLPVVEVKLDRLFLASVHEDPRVISIIRSTVDLAHSLNLRIVAEGVESQYGLKIVSDLGCDIAQGYYLGQPLPAAELFQVAMAGPAGPDTRPELAKVLGVRVPR